jgi:hypothetical protein
VNGTGASAKPPAADAHDALRRLATSMLRCAKSLAAELARLNRIGLPDGSLMRMSRRARARTVIRALAHRHDGRNRCC